MSIPPNTTGGKELSVPYVITDYFLDAMTGLTPGN